MRSISSAPSPIVASEFPLHLCCFNLLSAICENLSFMNGYSRGIINYNINDVLKKNRNKLNIPVFTVPKKDLTILLPYLGLESNQIPKRLKSCVSKFYPIVNMKVIYLNTRRIKSFFPYKDRLNRSQRSKVAYKAHCWDCGKTKRGLQKRKTEHFKALAKQAHIKAMGHNIKWDHFEILASGKTDYQYNAR